MLYTNTSNSTVTTTSNGCPYCGCTCGTGCGNSWFGWNSVLLVDTFRDDRQIELDRMLKVLKFTVGLTRIPRWFIELRAIPKRTKRPFPRNMPGPRQCHSNSRPQHRNRMRTNRLWRNRSGFRSKATAVSSTHRSNTGWRARRANNPSRGHYSGAIWTNHAGREYLQSF
jgi:hypothetical protein